MKDNIKDIEWRASDALKMSKNFYNHISELVLHDQETWSPIEDFKTLHEKEDTNAHN